MISPFSPLVLDSPVNLLLVDDQLRNLEVLETILQSPEYRLVRAPSGDDALLALMKDEFAAIVLDIQMPGMSGLELARLIKQRKRNQHIPILFLTAHFLEETDILEGYGVGAVDYLTKPLNPQILKSKVAAFVELFRTTRALARANSALEVEIAQRREAQEALHRVNDELEVRVQRRTAELSRSEEQFRRAVEDAPIPVIMQAEDGQVLQISKTWAHLTGYSLEEVPTFDAWLTHAYGFGANNVRNAVRTLFERNIGMAEVEFEIVTRSGQRRMWAFSASSPRVLGDGRRFVVGTAVDITESKQAEAALREAKEEAEAASKAKDDFLAALSHELRTPLNPALLLASERAKDASLAAEVREDFAAIRRDIELEARLIDDLLDVTRISRGKLHLEPVPVDLHALLHTSWERLEAEAVAKQLHVHFQLTPAAPWVEADPLRLQQIFWNVMKNAVRFTPAQGEIGIRSRPGNSGEWCVEITDSGAGIEPQELEQIFAPFNQGNNGHRFGGLGLGLAISRRLVELLGGRITAKSDGADRGATFLIELPAARPQIESNNHSSKPNPGGVQSAAYRILLVEDHNHTRATLARLLTQRGHEVATAENIEEALIRAQNFAFDLVLSDLGLPDGSGHDLMAELRQMRPKCRGIALSGYGMESDAQRSLNAGFDAHLTKPVDIHALEKALHPSFDA